MPTQPTTGGTFTAAGFLNYDNRFLERGKLRAALIRDARGSVTDLSPLTSTGAYNFSPFAQDGTWRQDLLAFVRVGGVWGFNPNANQGFHIVGAFKEGDGPNTKPNFKNDNFMIIQSNFPYDADLVEEGEQFSFTAVETAKPVIRRLRNNLALNASNGAALVETPGVGGLVGAGWSRPLTDVPIDRQVLLVSEFRKQGLPVYTVDGYSLVRLANLGPSKKDKKDSEAADMTWEPIPDGYFSATQDGVYQPILRYQWIGGTGWTALYSSLDGVWTITLGTQSSGTFTLSFAGATSSALAYTATGAQVLTAMQVCTAGLFTSAQWPSCTGAAGGPYVLTTPGPQYGAITANFASLTTPANASVVPGP
jgi:hypothetical protein